MDARQPLETSLFTWSRVLYIVLIASTFYIVKKAVALFQFARHARAKYDDIPHLPRHPVWGNLVNGGSRIDGSLNRHPDLAFEPMWEEMSRPQAFFLDFTPVDRVNLVVCDPEPAEALVQPSNEYKYSVPKSDTYQVERCLIGAESIIQAEGETWKHLRRRFNPGFQPKYLLTLAPVVVAQTRTFIERLKAAAATGETIELGTYTQDLTTDIITQLAVEKDLHAQTTPAGHGEKGPLGVFKASRILPSLVLQTGRGISSVIPSPLRAAKEYFYEYIYDRNVSGWVKEQSQAMLSPTWAVERKSETERSISQLAMLDMEPNKALITNTMHQVKSFIFAGQDTTSTMIQWICYELAKSSRSPRHAVYLSKLRAEHDSIFGTASPFCALDVLARPGEAEHILPSSLPYTTAFVKETLRLHPPAGTARLLPESPPFFIPIDGKMCDVAGTRAYVCQWILHRNEKVWGADAKVFRPERWLDEEYMAKLPVGAYRPFERGPRNCIGQELALVEGKVVLCAVARGIEWVKVGLGSEVRYGEDGRRVESGKGKEEVGGDGGKQGGIGLTWDEEEKMGRREEERENWHIFQVTSVPVDGMRMKVKLVES